MTAKFKGTCNVTSRELRIDLNGLSFLTICGKHINGGYACMPYWGFAFELSESEFDVKYNANMISKALIACDSVYLPNNEEDREEMAAALSEIITKAISEQDYNRVF